MNETEKRQKIVDCIDGMGIEEKIALHNTYCDAANCLDDCIYSIDEMEEILDGVDKWELVRMIRFGDFDFMKDFWGFNGYGNLDSYNAWELPVYAEDIADYVLLKEDSLGNDEIQEILDGEDELQELAAKIRAAKTWVEVEDELRALCEAAGMADEYKAADGDNFEAVIYKAAERLGVEI